MNGINFLVTVQATNASNIKFSFMNGTHKARQWL